MPAEHKIDDQTRIISTHWSGEATDNGLTEALQKYQEDIIGLPEYRDYNELVDFTSAQITSLSIKGLKTIGEIASRTDKIRGKTRLAIVTKSNMAINLAKLYALYRNFGRGTEKKEIRVFKNKTDALAWLGNDASGTGK